MELHSIRSAPLRSAPCTRARRGQRGFTLIELIIAMAAGLMVSMAAFMLAKNATNFFQHEARISAAQVSAMLGMQRLTNDLSRAAHLATPNIQYQNAQNGRRFCGNLATLPPMLKSLAGVRLAEGGSVVAHPADLAQSKLNGFNPDSVVVGGSFDSAEIFSAENPDIGSNGGLQLQLRSHDGAMARTRAAAAKAGVLFSDYIDSIFKSGRFLRIADDSTGSFYYGVIAKTDIKGLQPDETILVQLEATPSIPIKAPTNNCGLPGDPLSGRPAPISGRLLVSVVSRIRYDLRSVAGDPRFKDVVAPNPGAFDENRTELVRVELDPDGNEIASSLEVVAEFAVDLKFGVAAANRSATPVVTNYTLGDATGYMYGRDVTTVPSGDPQAPELIRSLQVRLATRSRAPDRQGKHPPFFGSDGRRLLFCLEGFECSPDPTKSYRWARMRTLYSTISLPNHGGFSL